MCKFEFYVYILATHYETKKNYNATNSPGKCAFPMILFNPIIALLTKYNIKNFSAGIEEFWIISVFHMQIFPSDRTATRIGI